MTWPTPPSPPDPRRPVSAPPIPAPPSPPIAPLPIAPSPSPADAPTPTQATPLRMSETIQGNILAGFLKDHQTFLFLSFLAADNGRRWLTGLIPHIALTKDVAAFNERFSAALHARGGGDPENLAAIWINVGLTSQGIQTLAPGRQADLTAFPSFVAGPAARAAALGDTGRSDPATWVVGGPAQPPIDAILTVAADDPDDLLLTLERMRALATQCRLVIVVEQRGATLPDDRAGHEHFGFKDGISQPGVRGFDRPGLGPLQSTDGQDHSDEVDGRPGTRLVNAGEFVLGHPRQPVAADPTHDSTPRPCAPWMADGSFQVFRRLAQDVPGFWAQVEARARASTLAPLPSADLLAAALVGRWRSGTPLDLAPAEDNRSIRDPRDDNNFAFLDKDAGGNPAVDASGQPIRDPSGHRCPRFAHIRKVYPRDDAHFQDERRRLLRRGIPYGLPFDPAAGRGHGVDAERGLVFVAFMASIEEQFEFLQQSWANSADFPDGTAGPDPIIGIASAATAPVLLHRDAQPDQTLPLESFVDTTGAVYAFAPSLPTLRQLAANQL